MPPTILQNDVLPAIKRDPGYLSKPQHAGADAGRRGGESRDSVNWQDYPQRGFPYMIRQQPGPENALGRLKVMFPERTHGLLA